MSHYDAPTWGSPAGIPEGSDFTLEAILTRNAALDTSGITTSGALTLTVSDSVLNNGSALLTDEPVDSLTVASGKAVWNITDTQSNGWQAGTYNGDIKLIDSGGGVTYWPISMVVRSVRD